MGKETHIIVGLDGRPIRSTLTVAQEQEAAIWARSLNPKPRLRLVVGQTVDAELKKRREDAEKGIYVQCRM